MIANNKQYILPMGSIVKLNIMQKEYEDTMFIVCNRFVLNPQNSEEYFEYELMLYPGGTKDGKKLFANNEYIQEVIFSGYTDEKDKIFINQTKKFIVKNGLTKKIL